MPHLPASMEELLTAGGVSYLSATPRIPVRDMAAALDFYSRILGFEVRGVFGEPPNFATLAAGDATISLVLDRDGSIAGRISCYLTVLGVDALFQRCKELGADLDSDLGVRDYGMKDFTVHDQDENHIGVGERVT